MASEFNPFSKLEAGLVAFSGGSSFAASLGLSNSLVSTTYKYLADISYCSPYCYAISYVVSVGVGSFTGNAANTSLRSYFLEKYKAGWLFENQGKHYVENGVLRKVPVVSLPGPSPLPEGLAFIQTPSIISGESAVSVFLRAVIACAISRGFFFVCEKVIQKSANLVTRLKGTRGA